MRRFALVALVLASAGCKKLDNLDKLESIDKKFDTLLAEVKALRTGKPPEDEQHAAKDDHGKDDEHAAKDDHGKDDEHAAKDEPVAEEDHGKKDAPKAEEKPAAHAAPHWDYKDAEAWGELSPAFAACKTGKHQSPIDIAPARSEASDIVFDYRPTGATVKDNGHTYQVDLAPGSGVNIDDKRYDLLQFHVHTPSEHTIAGEAYALEVHLVHKAADGKLAVIGVLVDRGPSNPGLAAAWKKLPRPDKSEAVKKPFNPATLLPADRTVFRYEGSLTTPPCGEGVVWNVMRHTVTHTGKDIDVARARFGDNARPVQAMNDRKLL